MAPEIPIIVSVLVKNRVWHVNRIFCIPSDHYNTAISSEIVLCSDLSTAWAGGPGYVVSQARLTSLSGLVNWVCPNGMQLAE